MDPYLFEERKRGKPTENIGGLFAEIEHPAPVRKPAPRPIQRSTSQAAHAEAKRTAPTKKASIRAAIGGARYYGITRLELVGVTGFLRDTINARVRELLDDGQSGIIERGERSGEGVLYSYTYAPAGL